MALSGGQISVLFLLNTLHMALSLHDSYWWASCMGPYGTAHSLCCLRRLMVLNFGNFDEIVLRNNWCVQHA